MRERCRRPENVGWNLYGQRGIAVCERWVNSFENFLADMGMKPTPQHTIERKDVAVGYCPENCCWATPTDQANNRRSNRTYDFNGSTKTVAQLAKIAGIKYGTLWFRLQNGQDLVTAMRPVDPHVTGHRLGQGS